VAEEPPVSPAAPKSTVAPQREKPEKLQLAKAEPPSIPEPVTGPSRGRVDGGVKNLGFLGFEAMKHELAPYLKEVRSRVEKRWTTALELHYTGTSPTKAVLDCAISPEGKLVYVHIVEPGHSPTYAPLCREAIEKAAPFSPFPFSVPPVYKSKNLEIRWTFSFLRG
jgi:hypothetical protein